MLQERYAPLEQLQLKPDREVILKLKKLLDLFSVEHICNSR
jgi:hypothetical protein